MRSSTPVHDVFICHASEDKDAFVRPLAEALRSNHLDVWYDEFSLEIGDSLRETIDSGLASSRFGIVVLSPSFFEKQWPIRELNGLVARETAEGRKMILPIWHNVNREQVLVFSPPLADLRAASSNCGIWSVVDQLLRRLRPNESPLVIARDLLLEKGNSPPVITEEWWLDIVEIKQAQFLYPDLNLGWRWIFPLPYPNESTARERGLNIAWTALQLDWADDGKRRNICQLTHPEKVHDYIREWPGLEEYARRYPATLALYAPQLTIAGFEYGFEDVFDELSSPDRLEACEAFRYGEAETVDGNPPLCGDFIAWRHLAYGNYAASELSYAFVNAHNTQYSRRSFTAFECLIHLLSDESDWMPVKLRETLERGFTDHVSWWIRELPDSGKTVANALYRQSRSRFSYTRNLKVELVGMCNHALHVLEIDANPNKITARFIERGFLEGYYDEQERIEEYRRRR